MQFETERLILRRPSMLDAPRIQQLAGQYEVAATTLNIPHPYPDGAALEYLDSVTMGWETLSAFTFAVVQKNTQQFIGSISLRPQKEHKRAELGYWIGIPYWNQGYATEAAQRVIGFGFQHLGLNRIHANHFSNNPASGRVMQKIGMRYEGTLRQHYLRFGEARDILVYGILRTEWDDLRATEQA
jgi:RimJ/RimL family protein N-acetyltransferase